MMGEKMRLAWSGCFLPQNRKVDTDGSSWPKQGASFLYSTVVINPVMLLIIDQVIKPVSYPVPSFIL
jgi:hypothetical protein